MNQLLENIGTFLETLLARSPTAGAASGSLAARSRRDDDESTSRKHTDISRNTASENNQSAIFIGTFLEL